MRPFLILLFSFSFMTSLTAQSFFIRGDVSRDGTLDLADAIDGLKYMFAGAPASCLEAIDGDDSGREVWLRVAKAVEYLMDDENVPPGATIN